MVATRRGTRVDPREEGESAAAEPTPMEVSSPNSPRHTRSSVRKDGQTIEHSAREGNASPLKSDTEVHNTQMSTRSRSRNEQLDTESWEVKSTSSNTSTTSHSKQSLGKLTDSTRKLRNRRSALITEPLESKEDAELSEAESHCSSVSTTARRRRPQTASPAVSTRSRKSVLPSEPTSDVSEAESDSSISGVKIIETRSTRSSRARHPSSLVSEPPKEPTSDAESCSSGFSLRPLAGRSRRRNPSNSQLGEVGFVSGNNKDDAQDQETLKKQSPKKQRVKSDLVLSSPRRSLRNPPAIQEDEVFNVSDHDEPESSDAVPDVLAVERPELEESSAREEESPVKGSAMSSLQSSETRPEEPDQLLSVVPMDEEQAREEHPVTIDNDATEDLQESTHMADGTNIHLFIDSDDSEKSEGSDDDNDSEDDHNMEEEEEDEVVEKLKSKKSSKSQLQNVPGDGLFVIDTAPRLDSSKEYFLEPEDDYEQVVKKPKSKKVSKKQSKSVEGDGPLVIDTAPELDSSKEYFLEHEDDDEQIVKKQKSKKVSKKQSKSVEGDGLFVIDPAPGVDSSKKYFLEPEDKDKKDKTEASEKGEIPEPEDEEDDDDFIDEDEAVDEEENLLNSTQSSCSLSTTIDTGINLKKMGGLYINFDAAKPNPGPSLLSKMKGIKKKDELLRKSVITPDFEKKESVPPYSQSKHKLKQLRKAERDKSTGKGWFDMKAPDMTPELKNDLKALKMRSAMDPKHFYKKNDREGFPKYFQVATVMDNPADFYHSRVPKKQRKRTIVEELLADSEFRRYNKKKYMEIMSEKAARAAGKKNRKKKKFRK